MSNKTITIPRLKQIIAEEITRSVNEGVDHVSIRDVVNGASKLLAAVEAFKESANGSMTSAMTPHLAEIQKTLENMVNTPGSYVDKKKPVVQRVTLKPVKSGKDL